MGQSTTPKALALGVSLSLACGLLPGAAFADEAPEDDASANAADSARGTAGGADSAPSGAAAKPDGYDKADFYSDNPVAPIARTLAVPLAANTQLRSLSNEMKYFARFESNQNYDQGLSWGDGYHAMGYYQFDNRYSLKSFISYCYNFDPVKYRMFSWVPSANISGDLYDGNAGCKPPLQIFRYSSVIFRNSSSEITGTPSSRAFRFLEELDVVSLLIR